MKHRYIVVSVFLSEVLMIYSGHAATMKILRPHGGDIPFADNPPSIIVRLDGARVETGAFSISIDGILADFEANSDGIDNDGDGLIDEPSESPIRWPEEDVTLFHGRWPWALEADDPLTREDDGLHTLRVEVISRPDIILEEILEFSIASTGGIDSVLVYPSPFNPRDEFLRVAYRLRTPGRVKIEVHDFYGSCISTVAQWEDRDAGWNDDMNNMWNGKTTEGEMVSNGVYFIRVSFKNQTTTNEWVEKCFVSY